MQMSFIRILLILSLLPVSFCTYAQIATTPFDFAPKVNVADAGKSKEELPYFISDVIFKLESDTIGLVGKRKRKEKTYFIFSQQRENTLKAIHSKYKMNEKGSNIKLRIEQFNIHSVTRNEVSPEDTFYYRCTFLLTHRGESDEELFHFKGKNLMGATELAEEAFHHYAWRNIEQSITQFTKSFRSTPQWDILQDSSTSLVQTNFLLNSNLSEDSIACRINTRLDTSYFYPKMIKDSNHIVGHCRPILTYAIAAEEKGGKLFLTIHTKAFISKNRSWIYPDLVSQDWFTYQEGHVKLCAMYGQKLQEEFQKTRFTYGEYKAQANKTYNKVYEEYSKMRKQYADETMDGKNVDSMKRWHTKLLEMSK